MVADVAVVAGEAHLAAGEEVVEAAGVHFVAEAQEDASRDVLRSEGATQERERSYADAASNQDRSSSIWREFARG
jgi:hypothetical protein